MKLLVISDVHSNIKALQAIEQQEKQWDAVLFAGDMLDYGLYPHEVIEWMQKNYVIAVAGNHDVAMVEKISQGACFLKNPLEAESFCEHNISSLTKEDKEYLSNLPLEQTFVADGVTYFMTHIYKEADEYALLHQLENHHIASAFDSYWQQKAGDFMGVRCLIVGHTHHCMMVQVKKDAWIINPGACGYRLGADVAVKGAQYVVIENGVPTFKWADYSTEQEYEIVKNKMPNLEQWQRDTGLLICNLKE